MTAPRPQEAFQPILLHWYAQNGCVYPWRYSHNPYLVMVSEFLLQQTRAEDAIRPYSDLVKKYGNIEELSDARGTFLKNIFGRLGLFYRADRLVSAARFIVSEFGGAVPDSLEKLLTILGIGKYSANAILCFGFYKRAAVADGNIIRIYSRLFGVKFGTSRPRYDRKLWEFATEMLPDQNYVSFNYALLDFGKLMCTARNPRCLECPFNEACLYFKSR